MKNTLEILFAIVVCCLLGFGVGFGGWKPERHVNWSSQDAWQADFDAKIKPLTERVQKLEAEVQVLKTNK